MVQLGTQHALAEEKWLTAGRVTAHSDVTRDSINRWYEQKGFLAPTSTQWNCFASTLESRLLGHD